MHSGILFARTGREAIMSKKCTDATCSCAPVCARQLHYKNRTFQAAQITISVKNLIWTLRWPWCLWCQSAPENLTADGVQFHKLCVACPDRPPRHKPILYYIIWNHRVRVLFSMWLETLVSEFFAPNPFVCVKLRTRDRIGVAALVE